MRELSDSIFIKCTPERAYNWFMSLDQNYKAWHPNHVECTFSPQESVKKGTIITSKEYLHNELHTLKMKIAKLVPNEAIVYKNMFPMSILSPKGSFLFRQHKDGITFTATLEFRLGRIFEKVFHKQIVDLINHMKEEGINLKAILEDR